MRSDSVPGIHYSSLIRGAWVDDYVLTQQLIGLGGGRGMTQADKDLYKGIEERLQRSMASYRSTIFEKDDQARFERSLKSCTINMTSCSKRYSMPTSQ